VTVGREGTKEPGGAIEIHELPPERLDILADIDRSEHIDTLYTARGGELIARSVDLDVPAWSHDGSGPHSVGALVEGLAPILERGARLLGAEVDGRIAGVAIVEERFDADMAWLVFLHVSRPFRRMGIAHALWDRCVSLAGEAGAHSMYVSATPSDSAVGFYTAMGCHGAPTPHPVLLAEEPEDIHLISPI
jgi:ribosomal protein S18 acetylase RimI-like enzyme